MPKNRSPLVALLLALVLLFSGHGELDAAKKKTKKSTKRRAAATRKVARPQPEARPVGATFEARLASLVNSTIAVQSESSIQVVEVESGRVIAERNPTTPVAPASNLKLFTTAAAMDLLGPGYQFKTTVAMRGDLDPQGTLHGDVKIVGGGDPTIGGRFHDGHANAVLEQWAGELKRAGIKTIDGNLIFEYGFFDTNYIHPSWPRDQLTNWYEAPIASLSMQEGCVQVRVLPSRPGQRAVVQLEPANNFVTVQNTCTTGGGRGGVFITRRLGTNQIIVSGNVPARSGATEIFVTIENPVHYFASVTRSTFEANGVRVLGQTQLVTKDARPDWKTVTVHTTPLPLVVYVINKKSQNQYAEMLLKTIGAEVRKDGSFEGGAAAVHDWLTSKVGMPGEELSQVDGSGMSRFNRASARAFIGILRYTWNRGQRPEFVSSMPFSGEPESRLRHRLNQPPFARQVYAKTGYISGVIGLSGYVHASSGKIYAFSFLFNKYRTGVWGVYHLQDEMLKEIVRSG